MFSVPDFLIFLGIGKDWSSRPKPEVGSRCRSCTVFKTRVTARAQRLFYLVEILPVHCQYLWTREFNVQCTGFDDPSTPDELEVQGLCWIQLSRMQIAM